MTTSEKVAYLKGLCEGMEIADSREGKLFRAVIDVLDDLTADLSDVQDAVEDLADSMDELGEDVNALEDEFYEHLCVCEGCDDCDEFCGCTDDCDDCVCEGDCDDCVCEDCCDFRADWLDEDEDEEDDDDFYSVECPGCGFALTVDESILSSGTFECPECGELIDFGTARVEKIDFEDDEDEE